MASEPPAGMPDIECLEVPLFVRGYHAYKVVQEPENGEMLELKRERTAHFSCWQRHDAY